MMAAARTEAYLRHGTAMDEKKILDEIKKSAENVTVPESLSPENMKQKLDAEGGGRNAGFFTKKYGSLRKYAVRFAEVAAVAAIVFAAGRQFGVMQERRTAVQSKGTDAVQYQAGGAEDKISDMMLENPPVVAAVPENAEEGTIEETQGGTVKTVKADPKDGAQAGGADLQAESTADTDPQAESAADADPQAENTADADTQAENAAGMDPQEESAADTDTQAENAADTEPAGEAAVVHEEGIAPIGNEDELYEALKERYDQTSLYRGYDTDVMYAAEDGAMEESVMDAAPMELQSTAAAGNSKDAGAGYSETNLRELGVDEGDIVKTDGEYIYIMKRDSSVKIVRADGTEMALIAALEPGNLSESVRDLYVSGNKLVMVTSGDKTSMVESEQDVYTTSNYAYVNVSTYDIADRTAPKLLDRVDQEGYYQSSRKVGDYVYLFTRFCPQIADSRLESKIMPLVNGGYMEADDIYVPESLENTDYLVIGSVNVNDPLKPGCHKAVVSGVDNYYVSGNSIFICNENYTTGEQKTDILKFGYEDGQIWGVGACSVQGYLNDTFSIDEYNGNLRVLTTRWDSQNINTLYVFDEQLQPIGRIDDIAAGETIRSARFMGDTGYFVTFRNTDPLFSVDLSDPTDPKIIGELKVTGFSSYLHYYGDNKLLGIGYDADAETGGTTGVKLSMFDISDPANVTEIKRYIIKDAGYVPVLSNYRAVMISPEKNLFGFVCDNNYLVFTYDEQEGFTNLLSYNLSEGKELPGYYYWNEHDDVRGLFIADTFYLAEPDMLRAFDMTNDFTQKAKLEL